MREINHLNLLNQLQHTLHKSQMRGILVHIVLSVIFIVEFDYECVCDAILQHQLVGYNIDRIFVKGGITWIPSSELSLPPITDLR